MADTDPALQISAPPVLPNSSTTPTDDANANEPPTQIALSAEQMENAGLTGLQVGQTFDVTLRCTVTDATNGVTADIEEASDGDINPSEGDPDAMDQKIPKPKSKVLSPKEAGFDDEQGNM